ncbi:MAG: hypothetical protein NC184_03720 [Roseburia sp.]|nr:hypothetical protein [Roseburia sp.]
MKKLISIFISICLCVTSIFCCIGCNNEKPYVDTSNAVDPGAFERPNYAKEMEEQHDALGREHIEIPVGVEIVTIDGEEYIPIDSLEYIGYEYNVNSNFILTCDQTLNGFGEHSVPFKGKLHGNNYKIHGTINPPLFKTVSEGEICNLIFSADLQFGYRDYLNPCILSDYVWNSRIYNIMNYAGTWQKIDGITGMFYNSSISDCENYADLNACSGAIVGTAFGDSKINNCKNYGHLSCGIFNVCVGGIVGDVLTDPSVLPVQTPNVKIRDCVNYGNLIGWRNVGGIVGWHDQYEGLYPQEVMQDYEFYPSYPDGYFRDSTISNCQNFGNIYRTRTEDSFIDVKNCFGGIAGIFPHIENCTNSGNIYGFESVDPEWNVRYIGGIAGAAVSVENCDSNGSVECSSLVQFTDDICGYYIK